MSASGSSPGLIQIPSHHPVAVTLDRLEALLKEKGVLVFARIDFSGDASRAGIQMRPEQMLIFGNPNKSEREKPHCSKIPVYHHEKYEPLWDCARGIRLC